MHFPFACSISFRIFLFIYTFRALWVPFFCISSSRLHSQRPRASFFTQGFLFTTLVAKDLTEVRSVFSTSSITSGSNIPPVVAFGLQFWTDLWLPYWRCSALLTLQKPSPERHCLHIMVAAYVRSWKTSCFVGFDTRLEAFPYQDVSVWLWWFPSGLY